MANSTPSSVLNELAKSNKVTAQYIVVKEEGPAHHKDYTVNLQIGGCAPYQGQGSSLKAARNAAADRALKEGAPGLHINPTVELNILSMKSGENATYRELDSVSVQPPRSDYNSHSLFATHQPYHSHVSQLQHRHPMSARNRRMWRMSVTICGRTYIGEGQTKSEARGNAASHALAELRHHLIERGKVLELEKEKQNNAVAQVSGMDPATAAIRPSSSVSKVHEVANRNKLPITFETVNENGPAHVKMFYIKCAVGQHEVLGQGVGKKAAKNDAAEKMLVRLKDIPSISCESSTPSEHRSSNNSRSSRMNRTHHQRQRTEAGLDPKLDPVTYLTQLMQLRKENAPVYQLKADNGPVQKHMPIGYAGTRMRYQMQVSIGEHHCTVGYGENKKKAKASAADNLLKHLGLDLAKLRAKKEEEQAQKLSNMSPASILSNALGALHKHSGTQQKLGTLNRAPGSPLTANNKFSESTIHELNHGECKNLPDKKRMEYAANLEKLQVIYNDFKQPDVNNEDHTCQLAVLCQNPVVFKGTGIDIESAREHASKQAIAYFSKK